MRPPAESRERYGPWQVLGELGRGGMSRVLLVERQSPPQQAALKVLPAFLYGEAERRRFRREQEILARIEHPNIARFLDAGETADGELYLVLEKVEGRPLDVYCAGLPPAARLQTFLTLCRAVAAAHQRLVLHCDLKPSNVLVREDGLVKLLDFGLARSASSAPTLGTVPSHYSTLSYASPEQLAGRPLTAVADVYSLAVMLYEIVTGTPLYGELGGAMLTQAEARANPPRAAARITAERRFGLGRGAVQDLDAVIAKGLRPEAAERYAGVEELIGDLEALLDGRPVAARQGEKRYAWHHFVRRHALGLALGSMALLFLLAATVVLGLKAKELAEERDLARQQEMAARRTAEFFLELIDSASNPRRSPQAAEALTIRALSNRALLRLDQTLLDAPLVRARVLVMLGTHHFNVGNAGETEHLVLEALDIWERRLDPAHPKVLEAMRVLALANLAFGNLDESERLSQTILDRAALANDQGGRAIGLDMLANTAFQRDRIDRAEALAEEAEALSLVHHGWGSALHEFHLMNLVRIKGILHRSAKDDSRLSELESLLTRLVRERRARRPLSTDAFTDRRVLDLATLLVSQGKLAEAEAELQTVSELRQRYGAQRYLTVRDAHPAQIDLLLADIKRQRGDLAEAQRIVAAAGADLRRDLPPDNPRVLDARRMEALILLETGRAAEANQLLEEMVGRQRLWSSPFDPRIAELEDLLAKSRAQLDGHLPLPSTHA